MFNYDLNIVPVLSMGLIGAVITGLFLLWLCRKNKASSDDTIAGIVIGSLFWPFFWIIFIVTKLFPNKLG